MKKRTEASRTEEIMNIFLEIDMENFI